LRRGRAVARFGVSSTRALEPVRRTGRTNPAPPRPLRRETGQGLIEYGLILAVMAVVCVVSLLFFSDQLSSLLSIVAAAV
jgi:Flp pilus assembly pilin Flp